MYSFESDPTHPARRLPPGEDGNAGETLVGDSLERLRLVVEHSPDNIFIQDAGLRYVWVSKPVAHLTAAEILGKTDLDLTDDPEEGQRLMALKRRIMQEGVSRKQLIALDLKGERHHFEATYEPWRDPEGRVVGLFGYVHEITELVNSRLLIEAMARESERQRALLQAVLDQMPAGVIIAEAPSGQIVHGNRQMEEIFRHPVRSSAEITRYEEWQGFRADGSRLAPEEWPLARSISTGEVVRGEEIVIGRGDGTRGIVSVSSAPVRDEAGRILAGVVIDVDVTDQRQAEAALQESEHRYRSLFEDSNDAILLLDAGSGRYLDCNRRAEELTGYSRAELLAMRPGSLGPPETKERAAENFRKLLAEGSFRGEVEILSKDGRRILAEASSRVIDVSGRPLIQGVLRDISERKAAEAALRESEDRFRTMANGLPFIVWVHDAEGKQEFVNETFAEFFGVPHGEMTGDRWQALVHPEDGPAYTTAFMRCVQEQRPFQASVRVQRSDGTWRRIESHGRPRFTEDGAFRGFVGASIDVTARDATQEELARARDRLETALTASEMGMWYWDVQENRMMGDRNMVRLFGLAAEDASVPLERYLDVLHEADRERVVAALRRVLKTGGAYDEEYRVVHPDGQVRWIRARGRVALDADGQAVAFPGIATDTTAQRQAQEALRQSEARYRTLFESIDEGFCIVEMLFDDAGQPVDYRFLEVNPAFERQSGLQGVVGQTILAFTAQHERHWFERYGRVATTGEPVRFEERAEGLGRWFDVFAFRVGEPQEHKVALLFNDTSARKLAEASLRELNEQLEERVAERTQELERRNHELQQFAYVASHDLQEPLRKVQTFASLMKAEYAATLDETATAYLDRMENAASRMSDLLRDMLSFSRIATRQNPFRTVCIGEVAREVLQDLDTLLASSGARVDVSADAEVEADPGQLRQVLNHLVLNGLKFQRPGNTPHLRISALHEPGLDRGDVCRIIVMDNGIGFDQKYGERIFEPFQRLNGRSEYPGTGMGLAICRRILERHHGTIRAESSPGKGSRFIVELPVRQATKA